MNKKRTVGITLILFFVATFFAIAGPNGVQPGTTVNVFVDGGINAVPFELYKDKIKQESGIDVVLTTVSQADVYTKLATEFASGGGSYDLVTYFPALLPEFASLKYLRPMDDLVAVRDPKVDDIIAPFRELYCNYDGKLYALTYDGDLHVYYYRKDVVTNPREQRDFKAKYGYNLGVPQTWQQQKDFAQFFTRKKGDILAGKQLTSDFYGNGMLLGRGWCHFEWMDHFTAYGGIYFDSNLKPMINGNGGVKALNDLKELMPYAPPGVLSWGYTENRGAFANGDLASFILWSDFWKISYDASQSRVVGKAGISHVPGALVDGKLVYRATMPFGRVMSVTSTSKHPVEAFWVASYMSQYASQTNNFNPQTGEDPFRYSQVNNPEGLSRILTEFSKRKVPVADCKMYLDAVLANSKFGYPDLNIPGSSQYMDVLDLYISKALSGSMGVKDALDSAAAEWNKISNNLGFDRQKSMWDNDLVTWKKLGYVEE
jgi:multiple sugar transport system substrate-binding protein